MRTIRFFLIALMFTTWVSVAVAADCRACGKEMPVNARFCPTCGTRSALTTATTPPTSKPASRMRVVEETAQADTPVKETGTLKIGSSPVACDVTFANRTHHKERAVLTFKNVRPGVYSIRFSEGELMNEKEVTVHPGRVSFVFGRIRSNAANSQHSPVLNRFAKTRPDPIETSGERDLPEVEPKKAAPPAGRNVLDANDAWRSAETLRKAVNPFTKSKRYHESARLYEKIINHWPESAKVEGSYYNLGLIYESIYFRNYIEAVSRYKKVIECNVNTTSDARFRIGSLYERLGDETHALEWYDLASTHSRSESVRNSAGERARKIREAAVKKAETKKAAGSEESG